MIRRVSRLLAALAALAAAPFPSAAAAQHVLVSPAGDSLAFETDELQVMLDTARALYENLELDPNVLYTLGFGPPVEVEAPQPAYPWNAVEPESDSTVTVMTPGNLREADRAYHNYAVLRMRIVRGEDPDDPCEELMQREAGAVSGFVDGWILARTLFGGPAFAPLDELAFARAAGHLRALLASRGDTSIGVCADRWAEGHPDRVAAFEAWRAEAFPGLAPAASAAPAPADTPPAAPADTASEAGED